MADADSITLSDVNGRPVEIGLGKHVDGTYSLRVSLVPDITSESGDTLSDTVWTDGVGFYVRREGNVDGNPFVVWEYPNGTIANPVISDLKPALSDPSVAKEATLVDIRTVLGAVSDPATLVNTQTSLIGAVRAVRDKLLGTLSVVLQAGSAVIGKVGLQLNGADVAGNNPLPIMGATSVSNFPATQSVANAGSFSVQNTAPVVGGNAVAVKVDNSSVVQPISASVLPLPTGAATDSTLTNRLGTLGQKLMAGSTPVVLASDQPSIPVTATLGAGSSLIGGVNQVASSSPVGALTTVSKLQSALASTNPTSVKNSSGRVYKVTGYNAATSIRWLKFYNKASVPVVGTDVPFFQMVLMPSQPFSFDANDIGYGFTAGIAYALTLGAADNDSVGLTAGDVVNLNVWYQ